MPTQKKQTIVFDLAIRDANVAVKLDLLRGNLRDITKELKGVDQGSKAFESLAQESAETRVEINKLVAKQRELRKELAFNQVAKDSLAGMRIEYSRLVVEATKLTEAQRKTDLGKNLIAQTKKVKDGILDIEAQLGIFTGNVGNYQKALLSLFDIVSGGLATGGLLALIAGLERLGERAVTINAKVSDSIANVAKAASASVEEIQQLSDKLELRITRTTLLDQLDIAKIGAKLGVAKEGLFDFVEAIDKVQVGLGEEFGGSVAETTDTLGKLRNVLEDFKTDDVAQDISYLGNALTFLEAQGVASAKSIADFAGRIGGVGSQLGATAGQVLGVSTTLAELGINAERGGSAFVRLMQRVAQSPADFAKAAGVNAKEFTDLVNTDIVGAVQLFLGKLNDKNLSNTQLQAELKRLKVNGTGTAEVVSKLGGNLELLAKRIGQAGDKLDETATLTDAFEKKNATLGAELQKLKNYFDNLFTNSAFADGLASLIRGFVALTQGVVGFIASIAQLPRFIDENKVALSGLAVGLSILNGQMILAALNSLRLAVVEKGRAVVTGVVTAAQWLLNAAMTANPIGLVITAVSLLVIGLTQLYENFEVVRAAVSGFVNATVEGLRIVKDYFDNFISGKEITDSRSAGERLGAAFVEGYNGKIAEGRASVSETNQPGRDRAEADRDDRQLRAIKKKRDANLDADAATDKSATAKAKKRQDELDNQVKRLNDIRKSIRDLDAQTVENQFDRKELEIKNRQLDELAKIAERRLELEKKIRGQGGKATAADKTEAELISEETASVVAAYEAQFAEVARARQKAQDDRLIELRDLSLRVLQLSEENEQALAQAQAEGLANRFAADRAALEQQRDERVAALNAQAEAGTLSRERYAKAVLRVEDDLHVKTLELEQQRAVAIRAINTTLTRERIDAARSQLAVQLNAIAAELKAEEEAIREKAKADGTDPDTANGLLGQKRAEAEAKRNAARLAFTKTEADAQQQARDNELAALQEINSADQAVHEDKMRRLEEEQERRKKIRGFLIDQAQVVAGAVFEIEKNRLEQEQDAATARLDAEYERKKTAAQGNAALLEKLDRDYAKRKATLEKEQARERKAQALKEAIINGALAVIKALPNVFLSIAAGIAAAAQIAVIANQKFARGGVPQFNKSGVFGGKPHSAGGTQVWASDGSRFEVEEDEMWVILNKRASTALRALSAHNHAHGGAKFAGGGALDFTPQLNLPGAGGGGTEQIVVVTEAKFSQQQVREFAEEVAAQNRRATAAGFSDADRLNERKERMEINRSA